MSKTEGESSEKKAVIILHQFPRTKKSINASPFPIKVETFLRMNKLEYTSGKFQLFSYIFLIL